MKHRSAETVVAHLDDVPQPLAVDLLRAQFQESTGSASSNFLVGADCQSTGPSLGPSSSTPESKNHFIESPGFAQTRRQRCSADLDGDMNVGGFARHLRSSPVSACRYRCPLISIAVSSGSRTRRPARAASPSDRLAAPRLEGPATDADPDLALFYSRWRLAQSEWYFRILAPSFAGFNLYRNTARSVARAEFLFETGNILKYPSARSA